MSNRLVAPNSYRPDIDGLRACAILTVVLYHVGIPGVSGGYIGVDVFFVISGFLITQQLISAKQSSVPKTLADFYARRCRRILPSLALVVITTLIIGLFYLLPNGEQQDLAKSAIATAAFISNIFFWRLSNDYFAESTELQPLLHTWSLSVEEQFYVLWPILLLGLIAIERHVALCSRWLLGAVLAIVCILSLAVSIWWTFLNPVGAFFLSTSRFWEIGVGAAAALLLEKRNPRLPNLAGAVGLSCIIIASTLYTPHTPFPGIAAVLPVFGTALVILAGAREDPGWVGRFLALPPLVIIGQVSYSWYLWHWPLLAIGRLNDLGLRNLWRDSFLAAVAFGVAFVSTRYIETPIRQKRVKLFAGTLSAVLAGIALMSIVSVASLIVWVSARSEYQVKFAHLLPVSLPCLNASFVGRFESNSLCVLSQGDLGAVFLVGDSYANHWAPALAHWGKRTNVQALDRSRFGCSLQFAGESRGPDDELLKDHHSPGCVEYSKLVIAEIQKTIRSNKPVGVIISNGWNYRAPLAFYKHVHDSLEANIIMFEKLGVRSLIIEPAPYFQFPGPACVARRGEEFCRIPREAYEEMYGALSNRLQHDTAHHQGVRLWNPAAQFCDSSWCYQSKNGMLLYSDTNHISRLAAERSVPDLAPHLDWLVAPR